MSIAYSSGPIVNSTFTATSKTSMVDDIKNNLVSAGWSVISGSSGSWVLESVATAVVGLKLRVVIDDTPTNCARIRWRNSAGSVTSTAIAFLLPDSATWRIIANNHGFWVMY